MSCLPQALQYFCCTGGQHPKLSPQMRLAETPQETRLQSQHQPSSRAPVQGCAGSGNQQRIPHALFITILAEVLMLHVGRRLRNILEEVGGSGSPQVPLLLTTMPVSLQLFSCSWSHTHSISKGYQRASLSHRPCTQDEDSFREEFLPACIFLLLLQVGISTEQ